MSDRDCDNCAHHSEGGCSVWECSFEQKEDDTISRQAAIDAVCGWCHANCTPCEFFPCGEIKAIQALPPAQPNLQPTCNNLATDTISRQAVRYKLAALVNEFEEILSHIREREVDDSVCGLCEYDGAYIGQSGDWCNECPGFEKNDCFKLKEKYRKEWTDING
jgi:hypothetical protein